MKLADFLQDLSLQGVKLWADGDRLRTAGSQTVLTSAVIEQLKQYKSNILQLLHEYPGVLNVHPLSHGQRALWFLWQLDSESAAYNFSFAARIHTSMDVDTWRSLFQTLVERHAILRSTFPSRDGEPFQQIYPEQAVDFATIDASTWSDARLNQNLVAISEDPFDLETELAMRVRWFTRSAQEHVLLIVAHHIVFDGWSQSILFKELAALYRASWAGDKNGHYINASHANGHSPNGHGVNTNITTALTPLEHTYQDYVEWQQRLLESDEGEHLWQYWQQQLAGELPVLNLPTDHPRPPVKTYQGAMQSFQLTKSLTQQLKGLAKDSGVTLYVLLVATFQVLLHRYSGQEDILLGSPSLGRSQLRFSEVVGYFVDPMVLRADLSDNPTFSLFLAQVRQTVLDGLAHQDYPFSLQVEQLQPHRDPSYSPIFQACFTYLVPLQDAKGGIDWSELGFDPFDLPRNRSQFDLHLEMSEVDVSLVGGIEYSTDIFKRETIERMVAQFKTLLTAIVTNPEQRLQELSLLPESEYQQLLFEWNDTVASYPKAQCIHQLFEAQVKRTPDAVAVNFNTQQLTYQTLNKRANQLAHYLQTLGVGPEVLVGIYVERSPTMMVGLLGILKAGGAYVPLDPSYPKDRIAYMLQDSAASVVLTQKTLVTDLPSVSAQVVCLDTDWAKIADSSEENVKNDARSDNLAYVIYTSGSTGQPKGVEVLHQGLMNYLCWCTRAYGVSEGTGALVHSSIGFDATITGLFSPLLVGSTVFLLPEDRGVEALAEALQTDNNFSLVKLTPAHLKILSSLIPVERLTQQTRAFVIGGEALVKDVIAPWLLHDPNTRLINEYGPTETVVGCCIYEVDSHETLTESIPIGRPIANTKLYILNSQLQPLPTGVPGELHIGGDGVARGYRNRPDLSAEKFISNPFGSGRLYKTGDLARYRPDGNIEYLGRIDHQVKIRGFRIELGEIEVVLAEHAQVKQAVVIAREDHSGDRQLVAYVTSQSSLISSDLGDFLKVHLPEYMVPDVYVQLADLPLTSNGKVDRNALPAPETTLADVNNDFVAPQTPDQKLIASIFSDVLNVSPVGLHQSFFELGGHSLLATQLIVRLRAAFDVDISLKLLFEASTVENLAGAIAARNQPTSDSQNLPQIQPDPQHISVPFPLNDIQQAYWLGRDASFDLGNISTQIYIELDCQNLALDRLNKSLQSLIHHHAMLRAVILPDGSQQISPEVPAYEIIITDLSDLDTNRQAHQLSTIRAELSHRMLPAHQWPLFDIKATRLGIEKTRLHLSFDALLADAASLKLLGHQWIQLYTTPETELPTLKLSFRDYLLAEQQLQTSKWYQRAEHYWFARLDSLPPAPELPLAVQPNQIENPRFQRRSYRLAPEHWQTLQARGQQVGLTPSGILLAAFSEILSLWSRRAHFTLNLTTFNRLPLHPEVNNIVGDFTSLTLLEVDFRQQIPFEERARGLQKQLFEDLDHLQYNGIRVLRELTRRHSTGKQVSMPVVFTSILGLQPVSETSTSHDITDLGEIAYSVSQTPQVWLDHQVSEDQDALVFNWDAIEALFPEKMLDEMFSTYCSWLEQLATEETAWHQTRRHQLLPKTQQNQRAQSNNTLAPISPALLQELFTYQVPQSLEQTAIIAPDCSITYRQLAQMAQCLGQKLQQQGAQRNTLVAVALEKSWLQVVAVLGILMSGAAYVPIDPQQPRQRQQQILEQSQAELVITHSSLIKQIGVTANHQILALDQLVTSTQPKPLSAWKWVQQPEDLAYVIFTSGSTGKPKGVAIDHRGAVNTLLDINRRFAVTCQDRVLALSALNFDLSVYDIFGVLAAGGTIVMPELQNVKEPAHWLALIRQHRITLWNTVPALAQMLADYLSTEKAHAPSSLRLALLSGDWLPLDLPGKLQQLWPDIQVNSLGGATEVSIWSITYPIDTVAPDWKSIPYGKPLTNQTFAALNEQLDPCPVWVPGDLYIGGIGLAIGYWQDEARTAASFINHPVTGERLYKTGDLGCYRPDGNIEFLGRKDFQVKIRGFRIELGEIEATLNQHPAVKQTVANIVGESLNQQLVAYIVAESESTSVNLAEAHDPSQLAGVILDPVERIEFKLSQPGLRTLVPNSQVIQLSKPVFHGDLEQRYLARQSYRQFTPDSHPRTALDQMLVALTSASFGSNSSTVSTTPTPTPSLPLSLESLSHSLSSLMGFLIEGAPLPKYLYPSAGNLYPVQLYLRVADGSIATVAAGIYYYHPLDHTLIKQGDGSSLDSAISPLQNSTNSSIELFLIGRLPAIEPLYGQLADTFCALEAGYMLEVLRQTATDQNLSLTLPPHSASNLELIQTLGLDQQQHSLLQHCVLTPQNSSAVVSSGLSLKLWLEDTEPLQLYLYLKPDHWDDLEGGFYRYYPDSQTLKALSSQAQLDETIYGGNQPIFDQASFSLFLVSTSTNAQASQTSPSQIEKLLKAGMWGQALMFAAPQQQLGLCPIGYLPEKEIAHSLQLEHQQHVIHSFVGGGIEVTERQQWLAFATKPTVISAEEELRQFLQERLPTYMVPNTFMPLEAIPLTANGKVNRKALPVPILETSAQVEPSSLQTPTQEIIANLIESVLEVGPIGLHDNFFELGGDSLLATQLIVRLRATFNLEIPLRNLFESPTVFDLEQQIQKIRQEDLRLTLPSVTPVPRDGQPLPLSWGQERLCFLDQLEGPSATYNVPAAVRLSGHLDIAALEQAFKHIVQRHEILRTRYPMVDGAPVQEIVPDMAVTLTIQRQGNDLSLDNWQAQIEPTIRQEAQTPFDLSMGPLLRTSLQQYSETEAVLLITMHHIIADRWSVGILVQEMAELYRAHINGQKPSLEPMTIQYGDYALWQRRWLQGTVLEQQLGYWLEQLADMPTLLQLPTDYPRPAVQSYRGAHHSFHLSLELTQQLEQFSQKSGVTLFMTLLAGFGVLLSRYSGQSDLCIGSPIANRNQAGIEPLIGYFANTLVLRLRLEDELDFTQLLKRVREMTLDSYVHQDVPFEQLVEALQPERSLSHAPLFQVMFLLRNAPHTNPEMPGLTLTSLASETPTTKFDLTLAMTPTDSGLECSWQYSTDLFKPETIARMSVHLQRLLESAMIMSEQSLYRLPLLQDTEQYQLLKQWNEATVEPFQPQCIHRLFTTQVAKMPASIAVVCEGQQLTYQELDQRSNQIAHYLRARGVAPGTLVGICMERSLNMVEGVLGILKAGGAYVPLDPGYPQERLTHMLQDSAVSVLLTQETLRTVIPAQSSSLICLDTDWPKIAEFSVNSVADQVQADDLAYVIYTSGSTGVPKGIMISHASVYNYTTSITAELALEDCQNFLLSSTPAADLGNTILWPALCGGKCLHLLADEKAVDGDLFANYLNDYAIDVVKIVPTHLAALQAATTVQHGVLPRKRLILGGDIARVDWVQQLQQLAPGCWIVNHYGPTETTVGVLTHRFQAETVAGASLPIGRPLANTQVYILDTHFQPVPIGVAGELCIGGAGLARGYLNRPELTNKKFIVNPFIESGSARLYRTGDLARYLPDGTIEFLGRIDHQVKVRGFRIELGEVEAILLSHAAVQQVVVDVWDDVPGSKHLIAYWVSQKPTLTPEDLRSWLQTKLPDHMVPHAFVQLEMLPLTKNGKVDRQALPVPDLNRAKDKAFVAPQTVLQCSLADIWKQVLRIDQVGLHDNFFSIGGDSILSIQVVSRARQAGIDLKAKQIFQYQTIAELSRVVDFKQGLEIPQTRASGSVPLTPIQTRFFAQNWSEPHHFNQAVLLSVSHRINPQYLESALATLFEHHDALRLRYTFEEHIWQQIYGDAPNPLPLEIVDLSHHHNRECQLQVMASLANKHQASLNLNDSCLIQVVLFQLGDNQGTSEARLLLIIHHLVVDGVSWRILLSDLALAYHQIEQGQSVQLPAKTSSFQVWSQHLQSYAQSDKLRRQMEYWLRQPWSRVRPMLVDHDQSLHLNKVASQVTVNFTLSQTETRQLLRDVPAAYNTQINDILLTALVQCLQNWTGDSVVLINLEGHGRQVELFENLEISRTVGWFTSLFPVLLHLQPQADVATAIKSIKEQLRRIPDAGIGYGIARYLSEDSALSEQLTALPEGQISFNYLGQFDEQFDGGNQGGITHGGIAIPVLGQPALESSGGVRSPQAPRSHLLDVSALVVKDRLQVSWIYSHELYEQATVERLAHRYQETLQGLIDHCLSPAAGGYTPSDFPTSAGLSQEKLDKLLAAVGQPTVENIYPLSGTQQGLLFHALHNPNSGVYLTQTAVTIEGAVDVMALRQAWQALMDRHGCLRTVFAWETLDQPLQIVYPTFELPWTELDWRKLTTKLQDQQLNVLLEQQRKQEFELTQAPAIALHLIQVAEQRYHLIWSHHHILIDGWCLPVLFQEMLTFYQAYRYGHSCALQPPRPYQDYIEWLQRQDLAAADVFWREMLQGVEAPTPLPFEQLGLHNNQSASRFDEQQIEFSPALTQALQTLAQDQEMTLASLIQAVWGLLLSRYSGELDVVFGVTVSGRPGELTGVETMVGLFINTLPLKVSMSRNEKLLPWLKRLHRRQLELQNYAYSSLADVQKLSGVEAEMPLFESIFVFENYPVDAAVQEQAAASELSFTGLRNYEQTSYPLTLTAMPGECLQLTVSYDTSRFRKDAMVRMLGHWQVMLDAIASNPQQSLGEIPLLTTAERHQLLVQWNDTTANIPQDKCIHQLFEAQVKRTPNAIAVAFEGEQLSYCQLDARANQLAHHLQALGVKPEVLIGLCVERSIHLVVGMLGILKAGGVYVPLDSTYPSERLNYILNDTSVDILLTQRSLTGHLPTSKAKIICLDDDTALLSTAHDIVSSLDCSTQPRNLAYVIYTSGSTGKPKGAMVEHLGCINHCYAKWRDLSLTNTDIIAQTAPIGFDISVWQTLTMLLVGGKVEIIETDTVRNPEQLFIEVQEREISILQVVPSLLRMMLEICDRSGPPKLTNLRWLVVTGEAFPTNLRDWWFTYYPNIPLVNAYGPAECSDDVTHHLIYSH